MPAQHTRNQTIPCAGLASKELLKGRAVRIQLGFVQGSRRVEQRVEEVRPRALAADRQWDGERMLVELRLGMSHDASRTPHGSETRNHA